MPNITPSRILDLARQYEGDFSQSWKRMDNAQAVIDGTYQVLKEKYDDFEPYHSPVPRASLQKAVERVVTYEPKPHVEPEGSSQKAKDVAQEMEKDCKRFLEGFTKAITRPPWQTIAWLQEARGKAAARFQINPDFIDDDPKREKGESDDEFARRTADHKRALTYGQPFIYEPIDTLGKIIHPPTLGVNPPWVILQSEMDVYEVLARWPHWSDPKGRQNAKDRETVKVLEYIDAKERGILADEEPVTRFDRNAKGSIIPNEYRRVNIDIFLSPYGQLPIMSNRGGSLTREERMAVSQIDLLMQNTQATDKVESFILLYLARYGFPLPYSELTYQDWQHALKDGYLQVTKGGEPPGVLKQDPLPAYIEGFLARLGQERDFATLPPVAVGLGAGGSSGLQQSQVLAQVDLQSITERKSISNAMERALCECWYAAKYILPESSIGNVTKIPRGDIPDAPRITVNMEPPDENKQARTLATALSMKEFLPQKDILEAGGKENTEELIFEKHLERLKTLPSTQLNEVDQTIVANSFEIVKARLAEEEAQQAAQAQASAIPPPPQPPGTNGSEAPSPMAGMPGRPAESGSPEEMALMQQQATQIPQGM